MKDLLSVSDVTAYIQKAEECFRHQECLSCECYLGYLTQLKLDSDQAGWAYLKQYIPTRDQIHACLGCDPCPPGMLYAEYLRGRRIQLK